MAKKNKNNFSDQEIIKGLQQEGLDNRRFTQLFYEQFMDFIYSGIKRHGLSFEDAQDAYSDAIIGVCRQINKGAFRGESKLSTYLFQSFSNRCVDRTRKSSSHIIEEDLEQYTHLPEKARNILNLLELKEDVNRVKALMAQLGEKCRRILMESEYYGYSMEEIAERMGFNKAATASNIKYRCMKRLKDLLAKKPKDD